MKKVLVMLALVSALIDGTAWCQSMVWEMPNIVSDTSIVRYWKNQSYVVYSRNGSSPGVIALHDNASGVVYSTTIPSNVIINDFRIANDTVFAGGSYDLGAYKQGLIACFAINDLQAGNGTYYAYRFLGEMRITCGLDNNYLITGVKRIALYNDGNHTRIAYVADNIIFTSVPSVVSYYRIGYGDIAFLSTGWDPREFHYNKDGYDDYTDITTTDNHIVVTAQTNDSLLFKFQVFNKVAGFAAAPPIPGTDRYGYNDHTVFGNVMAVGVGNDNVAMAYHYGTATSHGVAVKMFDLSGGAPILLHSVEIPFTPVTPLKLVMRDIRLNNSSTLLWILNDIDNPTSYTVRSHIVEIPVQSITSGVYSLIHYPPVNNCFALDNFGIDGFIESGISQNTTLSVYNENISYTITCGTSETIKGLITNPRMYTYGRHHCTYIPQGDNIKINFTSGLTNAINICN